jgi:predicted RND superfamily exporter protein
MRFWPKILSFTALSLFLLLKTDGLKQNNREELFLSSKYISQLSLDRELNPAYDSLILSFDIENNDQWYQWTRFIDHLGNQFEEIEILDERAISRSTVPDGQNEFFEKNDFVRLVHGNTHLAVIKLPAGKSSTREEVDLEITKFELETGKSVGQAGMPALNLKLGKMSEIIKKKVMPGLFLVSFVVLWLMLGSLVATLSVFIPSLLSAGISLFVIQMLFGYSTMMTTLVPLLTFIVLMSLVLHLYMASSHLQSVQKAWALKSKPMLWALATTLLGLGSLYASDLEAIREFSLASVLSLIFGFFFALVFWFLPDKDETANKRRYVNFIEKINFKLKKRTLIIICSLVTVMGLLSVPRLPIMVEALYFFPPTDSFVQGWKKIETIMGGVPLVDLSVEVNGIDIPEIKKIEKIEQSLKELPAKIVSSNEIVKAVNKTYQGINEIPDHLVSYQTLLSRVAEGFRPKWSESNYLISLIGKTNETELYRQWLSQVDEIVSKTSGDVKLRMGGLYYWLMRSQSDMIVTLLESFLSSLIFVSLFVFAIFKSLKRTVLFFFVNMLPAAATLCVFWGLGLSLNIASITTFSISFGLIVDSTLHLMSSYDDRVDKETYNEVVLAPMFIVTITMMVGFLALMVFPFSPVRDFGMAMAMTLFFGLLADFFIVPAFEEN